MTQRVQVGRLQVAEVLHRFVREEALPGSGVDEADFWAGADALVHDLGPGIRAALARRDVLQTAIDAFHRETAEPDGDTYETFLRSIGYLVDQPEDFTITTADVDPEIAAQPGPQLVVPLLNARFAANAVNARWLSLYDALYGTDVVPEDHGRERGVGYNPVRGQDVVARGRSFLDSAFPLTAGSHADAARYAVTPDGLEVTGRGGHVGRLLSADQFVGLQGDPAAPEVILLVHHGLHVEIRIDPADPIGASDPAGVRDIVLEAAVTTIMDLEDSVAAVDPEDKVAGYRNWLHLMQGRLTAPVTKGGRSFVRGMNADRVYATPTGQALTLPGRALLFIRQVGHLMTSEAILDAGGEPVPEGILDALVTGLGSAHDLRGPHAGGNSRTGSVYVVKPKLHGPDEVALACEIFARTEQILGFAPRTIKIGIMDEERRTSANLKACIHAARDRVAFVNTGFLDRTGDEIHTSMIAGPMVRKGDMKGQPWITAYEDANVDIALACGFQGRAQIGKGMWAAPDEMADMSVQKIAHPMAGATCAWVPSPTAATLHALHYHAVDVMRRQRELTGIPPRSTLRQLLTLPLGDPSTWTDDDRRAELDNNIQGVLGYVVRWVEAGVGCSKVPDIHGTALMEDRATCRISSQHVANWLLHGVVGPGDVEASLRRMAIVVDGQNAGDPGYVPMAPGYDGEAFLAARELVLEALHSPSGYTEPILHRHRLAQKSRVSQE